MTTFCTNVKNLEKYVSDPPTNDDNDLVTNFEIRYKPWPFRMYGFNNLILSFASEPQECETVIETLLDWINK